MEILKRPILSEKLTDAGEKLNTFGFIVDTRANKVEIKKAVEQMYSVSVDSVRTINYSGKLKSRHTKAGFIQGRANKFKKAYVKLAEGDTIDFYSNI